MWGETIRNDKYSVILETNQQATTDLQARDFNGGGVEAVSWAHAHERASAASHSVPCAPVGDGDN